MIALLFYVLVMAALIGGIVWIADRGGSVTFVWDAWEVTTETSMLILGILLLVVVSVVAVLLFQWFWRAPRRIRLALGERRKEKGWKALTSGLVAVAAGDAPGARAHARRADRLLDRPPLTLLLTAQAAQLDGDDNEADRRFRAMLERPETEFLGLRGLMAAALRKGDHEAAAGYARKAHALRPDAAWAAEAVFELQTRAGDWTAARQTLKSARDRKVIEAAPGRRRHAVLLVEEAVRAHEEERRDEALKLARTAHGEAPDLVPAGCILARLLIDSGKGSQAVRVVEKTWKMAPHPDLADLYIEIWSDEGANRYRRMERLLNLNVDDREAHVAAARVAMESRLTGEMRRHLNAIGTAGLVPREIRLWVDLETSENNAEKAAEWQTRMIEASPDRTWQCSGCGQITRTWRAVCDGCGRFDSMVWRSPGAVEETRPPFLASPGPAEPATLS